MHQSNVAENSVRPPAPPSRKTSRRVVLKLAFVVLLICFITRPLWEPALVPFLPDGLVSTLAGWLTSDADIQLEAGIRARDAGRLPEAVRALAAAASADPQSARIQALYASVLADGGDFEWAARVFQTAVRLDRDDPHVQTLQARYLYQTRDPLAAEAALKPVLQSRPDIADAWHLQALCRSAIGDSTGAASAIDKAIRLAPRRSDFYREAAQIRHGVGKLKEAERFARTALSINPNDSVTSLVLGRILLDRDQTQSTLVEAEQLLARAAESPANQESYRIALRELGRAAYHRADCPKAVERLRSLCDKGSTDPTAHYYLAKSYRRMGDRRYHAAITRFRKLEREERTERFLRGAVKEQVGELEPRRRLATFYARQGRPKDAAEVIRDYLQHVPDHDRALQLARELRIESLLEAGQ
jgi:tetratricopeptide (TPR) repeat protein